MVMKDIDDLKKRNVYFRLLAYARPYLPRLLAALGAMILASMFAIVPPWLMKNVIDDVLIKKNMMMLNFVSIGLVLLYVGKGLASYGQKYLMTWVGQRIVLDLRLYVYRHMQRMSLQYINGKRVGELLSRLTNDVGVLQNMVTNVVVDLVVQGVTFLGMLGFLIYINWRLTLVTFAIIPLTFWILDRASRKLRKVGHEMQEQIAGLSALVEEALSAVRIVRAFATEDVEGRRFHSQNLANFKALMRGTQVNAVLSSCIDVILISALAVILWLGGRIVISGGMTPGELIAFLGYLGFIAHPINTLTRVISQMQLGLAAAERIFDLLDQRGEVVSPPSPVYLRSIRGCVDFEDVWFRYDGGRLVLKGLNFSVRPGEQIAIVGPTGVGKSTLVDLIERFYDPLRGRISIDGHDIRTLDLTTLRRQIGIVPQDPLLMTGSIAYNIGYGYDSASDSDIVRAADIAGIRNYIEEQPEGYSTKVGERGVTLSGGQRQRIAIARAIVRDPRIIIMDEATSSLDVEVEHQIQEAMQKAMEGRTSFVIAHRLSTIRNADRIMYLDDGIIAEQGSHEELLAKNGLYSNLYSIQFGRRDEPVNS